MNLSVLNVDVLVKILRRLPATLVMKIADSDDSSSVAEAARSNEVWWALASLYNTWESPSMLLAAKNSGIGIHYGRVDEPDGIEPFYLDTLMLYQDHQSISEYKARLGSDIRSIVCKRIKLEIQLVYIVCLLESEYSTGDCKSFLNAYSERYLRIDVLSALPNKPCQISECLYRMTISRYAKCHSHVVRKLYPSRYLSLGYIASTIRDMIARNCYESVVYNIATEKSSLYIPIDFLLIETHKIMDPTAYIDAETWTHYGGALLLNSILETGRYKPGLFLHYRQSLIAKLAQMVVSHCQSLDLVRDGRLGSFGIAMYVLTLLRQCGIIGTLLIAHADNDTTIFAVGIYQPLSNVCSSIFTAALEPDLSRLAAYISITSNGVLVLDPIKDSANIPRLSLFCRFRSYSAYATSALYYLKKYTTQFHVHRPDSTIHSFNPFFSDYFQVSDCRLYESYHCCCYACTESFARETSVATSGYVWPETLTIRTPPMKAVHETAIYKPMAIPERVFCGIIEPVSSDVMCGTISKNTHVGAGMEERYFVTLGVLPDRSSWESTRTYGVLIGRQGTLCVVDENMLVLVKERDVLYDLHNLEHRNMLGLFFRCYDPVLGYVLHQGGEVILGIVDYQGYKLK
ncbi:hypothetical protein CANCADRAFT_44610 [Tortispora caseinolytica NRRL Y-17796]|uniref:Uncharacterized protein n=1 Tax=Tortispora caseinolytica NRRL Y-17796 TaxID=767744 RepID=A0A1E4TH06_9ASCO|nr:hypothetical protein CANCADRAFT_44610 [Tortispora caseinolytica NRRL Y-17796]